MVPFAAAPFADGVATLDDTGVGGVVTGVAHPPSSAIAQASASRCVRIPRITPSATT